MASNWGDLVLLSGNGNRPLAEKIATALDMSLASADVGRFPDGEVSVELNDQVHGRDVFIIQPTCPPVNDNLMELIILITCCKLASAARITAVMPYFGYARQDQKKKPRVPITAKTVARMLEVAGADRIITLDLHAGQIQGFFDIPVDHLYGSYVFIPFIRENFSPDSFGIGAPDVKGGDMADAYGELLEEWAGHTLDPIIIRKRRLNGSKTKVRGVIGDPRDINLLLVDDMFATGGSNIEAEEALRIQFVRSTSILATHGVFAGKARATLLGSPIRRIIVSDTIPQPILELPEFPGKRIEVVSTAALFAKAIRRIHEGESVSSLFVKKGGRG